MGRAQPPSTDLDTVWLRALIEAMEEVAASSQACEPSDIKAFSNRLNLPVMPSFPDGFRWAYCIPCAGDSFLCSSETRNLNRPAIGVERHGLVVGL
jgi:hypothetical protein